MKGFYIVILINKTVINLKVQSNFAVYVLLFLHQPLFYFIIYIPYTVNKVSNSSFTGNKENKQMMFHAFVWWDLTFLNLLPILHKDCRAAKFQKISCDFGEANILKTIRC